MHQSLTIRGEYPFEGIRPRLSPTTALQECNHSFLVTGSTVFQETTDSKTG
ncbi:MAG: hypothetical protein GF401_14870 [Chitinivibrionales bacterium]|nr:hypothetical protein [Chitinivibrionales bacterium]